MLEEIHNSLKNLQTHIGDISRFLEQSDLNTLYATPHLLRSTNNILHGARAFLIHVETLKHQCWQMYGGQAYAECPELMFAPIGNWHGMLDIMQCSLGRLEKQMKVNNFCMH